MAGGLSRGRWQGKVCKTVWMVGFIVGVRVTKDRDILSTRRRNGDHGQHSPALCDQGACWNDPVAEREKASCPARLCRLATSVLGHGFVRHHTDRWKASPAACCNPTTWSLDAWMGVNSQPSIPGLLGDRDGGTIACRKKTLHLSRETK